MLLVTRETEARNGGNVLVSPGGPFESGIEEAVDRVEGPEPASGRWVLEGPDRPHIVESRQATTEERAARCTQGFVPTGSS